MTKIMADILVPPEFLPPSDLDYTQWEQCLTFMLRGQLPQLLADLITSRPHLAGINMSPRDIDAQYRAHNMSSKRTWRITIRSSKAPLGTGKQLDQFKTDLDRVIRGWFLSKDYKGLDLRLDIE
jgi:hypothetical protein